jgi:hypothetical protein
MEHNVPGRPGWRPWTIWPPCLLGAAWSVLAVMAVMLVEILSSQEGSRPVRQGWMLADVLGQVVMLVASVALLAAGIRPARRRRAAIAAWLIIPLSAGWFALTVFLAAS